MKKAINQFSIDEIYIGQEEKFKITITNKEMESFFVLTGDINPLHNDSSFSKQMGYDGKVVYGMLTAAFLSTLAGTYLPGKYCIIQGVDISFHSPTYIGDELYFLGKIEKIYHSVSKFDMSILIKNQEGKKVVSGLMRVGILNEG
jgi:3-hydroxybutyryl-CoA dehydratase